jgi:hypothetical protein
MPRKGRIKESLTLEVRLEEAINLRRQAEGMPPGIRRDELLRKANQAESAAHVDFGFSELPPPK